MTQINIGTTANDNTGDNLRAAFGKVNDNSLLIQNLLDDKADLVHTHIISEIIGLQSELNNINTINSQISDIQSDINTLNNINASSRLTSIEAQLVNINASIITINTNIAVINQKIIDIINQIN